jgi:putative aminopeptidase FrvX
LNVMDWDLLKELCSIQAVSGCEDAIIRYLREYLSDYLEDVFVDNLGTVTGTLKGSREPERTLMLQAHLDELGLIVRNITEDGFLLIERVGGIPEKSLLGERVDILTDSGELITGYVGAKSHHITPPEEKFRVPSVHDMYVDVGLPSREAVRQTGIQVGDPMTYHPNFNIFGDGQICSKALDDRVGVYILLEVMKRLIDDAPPWSVVFTFSVLEEVSVRGSLPAVNRVKPDAIISLDVTIATDTPTDERLHPVGLRGGPAIKLMDFHGRGTLGGIFSSPPLRRFIEQLARENDIPLQREVLIGIITDASFQLSLGEKGYTIAALSIPQRYSHSAISMCHQNDIRQMVDLLTHIARSLDSSVELSRG